VADPAARRMRRLVRRVAARVGLAPESARREAERQLAEVRKERDSAQSKLFRAYEVRDDLFRLSDSLAAQLDAAHAADDVASGRDRTDVQYVFVVTYGRSGSTLLAGILSSTPGVMIRGENGGVLKNLLAFHETATRHRERVERNKPLPARHPWWGIDYYSDETAYRAFRTLMLETVLRPEPSTTVLGFKEIDWLPERVSDLLAFTRAVFPGARFILNTRDLERVAQSGWWADRPDALSELHTIEQQLAEALEPLGDLAYRVHYDDYVADPTALRGLFAWLDLEFDEDRVRAQLELPHSY
jgi:sulfotransferase family protein